jgi:hypothetical protein
MVIVRVVVEQRSMDNSNIAHYRLCDCIILAVGIIHFWLNYHSFFGYIIIHLLKIASIIWLCSHPVFG